MGAVFAFLICLAVPCAAESLSSVRVGSLPPIETGEPIAGLTTLDGRLVAIGATSAWVLDADQRSWMRSQWHSSAPLLSIVGGGREAFLLLGKDGPADRVERLSLTAGALNAHALAPLPVALEHARGAVLGDVLLVAGTDTTGQSSLLQMRPALEQAQWSSGPGWPGGGALSSMVTQTSALFVTISDSGTQADRMFRWSSDKGWLERAVVPGAVVAGSGRAIGQAHV
ncbi:MAG: hypothetical protein ACR2GP_11760, partial [Burkholderiaceae bacterium]